MTDLGLLPGDSVDSATSAHVVSPDQRDHEEQLIVNRFLKGRFEDSDASTERGALKEPFASSTPLLDAFRCSMICISMITCPRHGVEGISMSFFEEVKLEIPLGKFREKLRSFGWEAQNCHAPILLFGDDQTEAPLAVYGLSRP